MNRDVADAELLRRVVAIANDLPPAIVEAVCARLESLPPLGEVDKHAIAAALPQPGARSLVEELMETLQHSQPPVDAAALAWALRGAAAATACLRRSQSLELVWTGPASAGSGLRRTDQVLLDLISGARESILIAAFAAYKIPDIARALVTSANRGVRVTLIVESASASEGKVSFDCVEGLGQDVAAVSKVYVWPMDQRQVDADGHHGSLHVKCALADDRELLISSANLTGYALNLNMELGVLIEGGELPRQVGEHLWGLIHSRVLQRADTAIG